MSATDGSGTPGEAIATGGSWLDAAIRIVRKDPVRNSVFALQQGVGVLGYCASAVLIFSADWLGPHGYWAILLLPLFGFASIAIHELGHFLAARAARMIVICARVGFLEFWMLRDRTRVRFCRPALQPDWKGYLLACPDFSRSLRRQQIMFVLGGPLANLMACAAAGLIARSGLAGQFASTCDAFAAINLVIGIVNLLPDVKRGSDGYQLLEWLRGYDPADPALAHVRLIWRSLRGETAECLPQAELDVLDRLAAPMPLIRKWYDMKAAQNLGDWAKACEVAEQIETGLLAMHIEMLARLVSFLNVVRAEQAFSEAMLRRDSSALRPRRFESKHCWHARYVMLRLQAVDAALRGDAQGCKRFCGAWEREVELSIDTALHASEHRMRDAVRTLLYERIAGAERDADIAV
jgi:hypothetical protein